MTQKDYIQTFSIYFKLQDLEFNYKLIEYHLKSLFSQKDYSHESIINTLQNIGINTQFNKTYNLPINKWIIALVNFNNKSMFINIKVSKNKKYVLFQPINKNVPIKIDYQDFIKNFQGLSFSFISKKNITYLYLKKYLLYIFLPLSFLFIINNTLTTTSFFLYLLNNLGLFFSLLMINETIKFSYNNFCQTSNNNHFNCDSVLNSKFSYIFKHFKVEDLSAIFFSTLLILTIYNNALLTLFPLFSLTFIPIIIISIYFQKIIIKKWCLYCLIIDIILLIFLTTFYILKVELSLYFLQTTSTFLILFFINSLFWYNIKPYIIENNKNIKYKNLTKSYSYFKYLFHNSSEISNTNISFYTLTFGKSELNKFILIIKPNCIFCHQLIPFFLELIDKNPNSVQLKIVFNVSMNNHNQILLANELIQDKSLFKKWSTNFNKKIKPTFDIKNAYNYILLHKNWCLDNKLEHNVPKVIFNKKLLPMEFEYDDLKNFIKNLINS